MRFLGIDPGGSGAVVALAGQYTFEDGSRIAVQRLDSTEKDVSDFIKEHSHETFAYLERAQSMPKQGVVSSFKFGVSYGFLRGCLVSHGIAFEEIGPRKWQTALGCLSGGDKNVTKARAQQLFPGIKVTHHIADALLIAEFCRRARTSS